jgi:conjugative relaxase-like TrwC/TraI family protein
VAAVLSIGKLAGGAEGYYLRAVASGVEGYYLGSGEAPGRWVGAGSVRLGLAGVVSPEQLRAVLDGRDPTTGKSLLWVRRPDRLPGLDLTFSAPKSVSLLFALGDEQLSALVRRAHDAAVTQALGYLEREAGEVRRGKDGRDRLPGGGFVAAAFRHRTSRAGDPQLHTHVLVANMTRGSDGRWSALDGRQLYLQAKTAGTLYQAELRDQLAPLGLAWTLHPNGTAEIDGIPRSVLRGFSRRREQIEAELAAHGATGPRAAQLATLATRPAKQPGVDPVNLAGRWQAQAHELGFDPADLPRVLGRTSAMPPSREVLAATADRLLGPDGLTARSPVFDRRAAIRAWCGQLPAGACVRDVEALADRLLADPRVLPVDAGARSPVPGAGRSFARHTTVEMLTVERFVLDTALAGRGAGVGVADPATVQAALAARPGLHPEQVAMVSALTGRGDLVQVVVGKAGSGKSHALAAAAQAWTASGLPVLGAAVAARAASELSAGTGMPALTVARLLSHAEHPGPDGLPRGLPQRVVLIVDEAGMLGTRPLARLLHHVHNAGGCLVLVGDHHQLPELDAGGTFAALARRLDPVLLRTNHRQEQPWERAALDELRAGDVPTALAAYDQHGRLHLHDTAEDQRAALVAAWWDRTTGRPATSLATSLATDLATSLATDLATSTAPGRDGPVLMLAARRADVDDLNRRARTLLATHGQLTGPVLEVDVEPGPDAPPGAGPVVRRFAVGDRVIARTNHYRSGLLNGHTGTVVAVHPATGSLEVRTPAGQLRLGPAYLTAGGLDHGYAITIHQAQGLTTDTALLLGASGLYREAGYVALSRGRSLNAVHLLDGPDHLAPETEPCQPHPRPTTAHPDHPRVELVRVLGTTRAQAMASDLLKTTAQIFRPAAAPLRDRVRE